MGMTDYRRIPIRLSYCNPEHVKIMDILDDLNLDVHKSRNQFIINAITFYVEAIRNDTLTYTEERRQREMEEKFVTHDEMLDLWEKFSDKVKTELYEEMIKFLAGTFMTSGTNRALPNASAGSYAEENTESREDSAAPANEDVAETLSRYDNVLQQVMSWSEDD